MITDLCGGLDNGVGNLGIQSIELFVDVSAGSLQVAKRMDDGKLGESEAREMSYVTHSSTLNPHEGIHTTSQGELKFMTPYGVHEPCSYMYTGRNLIYIYRCAHVLLHYEDWVA